MSNNFSDVVGRLTPEQRSKIADCLFMAYAHLTAIDIVLIEAIGLSHINTPSSDIYQLFKVFKSESHVCETN